MTYLITLYLAFIVLEAIFVLAVKREPSKVENMLLWPVAKLLVVLNKGLKKISK